MQVSVYFFPWLNCKFTKGRNYGLNVLCSTLCKYANNFQMNEWTEEHNSHWQWWKQITWWRWRCGPQRYWPVTPTSWLFDGLGVKRVLKRKENKKGKGQVTVRFNTVIQLSRLGGLAAKIWKSCSKNHQDFIINSCKQLVSPVPTSTYSSI